MDNQPVAEPEGLARSKGQYYLWGGALGLLATGIVIFALSLTSHSAMNSAPDLTVNLYQHEDPMDTASLKLRDLRGKPVVLNFWAGLCPPCRAEMPDLQLFHDQFKNEITLIGVDLGPHLGLGTQNDAENLLKSLNITYITGSPDDSDVIIDYDVLAMPTTVFIDSHGNIFRKWIGLLNMDALTDLSREMLALESKTLG